MQTALLCGCGSPFILRNGMCPRCLRRDRHSRENFDGLRELILERDGWQCQCCGEVDASRLVVHHRRPGFNRGKWLITICRACHVRVHLMYRPGYACPELLLALWREIHPAVPLQARLPLEGGFDEAEQVWLFPGWGLQGNGEFDARITLSDGRGGFGRAQPLALERERV